MRPVVPFQRLQAWLQWTAGSASRRIRTLALRLESARLASGGKRPSLENGSWVRALANRLPNRGPVPLLESQRDPTAVLAAVTDGRRRGTQIDGFEGLALDDALTFTDESKSLSFLPLAKAIRRIGQERFGGDWSVLELGCGGGDLFFHLRTLGVANYLGVDGNPVAFEHSPHIKGHHAHFRLFNLQEGIDFGVPFDIVCSFEVLEHIPVGKLPVILETVRRHMSPRSIFLGTASLQEELDVHVTVRPREFWLQEFHRHGLVPAAGHAIYEELLAKHHPFNWDRSNTNVFAMIAEPAL